MNKDGFFAYRMIARILFCLLALRAAFSVERSFWMIGVIVVLYALVEFGISVVAKWKHAAERHTRELEARRMAELEARRKVMELQEAQVDASKKYFNPTGLYQKSTAPKGE